MAPRSAAAPCAVAAAASASRSACGSPAARCQPLPRSCSFLTISAPTGGLGAVCPMPLAASASARVIQKLSSVAGEFTSAASRENPPTASRKPRLIAIFLCALGYVARGHLHPPAPLIADAADSNPSILMIKRYLAQSTRRLLSRLTNFNHHRPVLACASPRARRTCLQASPTVNGLHTTALHSERPVLDNQRGGHPIQRFCAP